MLGWNGGTTAYMEWHCLCIPSNKKAGRYKGKARQLSKVCSAPLLFHSLTAITNCDDLPVLEDNRLQVTF